MRSRPNESNIRNAVINIFTDFVTGNRKPSEQTTSIFPDNLLNCGKSQPNKINPSTYNAWDAKINSENTVVGCFDTLDILW